MINFKTVKQSGTKTQYLLRKIAQQNGGVRRELTNAKKYDTDRRGRLIGRVMAGCALSRSEVLGQPRVKQGTNKFGRRVDTHNNLNPMDWLTQYLNIDSMEKIPLSIALT